MMVEFNQPLIQQSMTVNCLYLQGLYLLIALHKSKQKHYLLIKTRPLGHEFDIYFFLNKQNEH